MGSKNRKGKKSGISNVKKKNIKGGKMSAGKKTKNKTVVLARRKLQTARRRIKDKGNGAHPEVSTEDVLDMLDEEDLQHMRDEKFKDRHYLVASEASKLKSSKEGKRKKGEDEDEHDLEEFYERKMRKVEESGKRYKELLPLKTKHGLQMQVAEDDEEEGAETNAGKHLPMGAKEVVEEDMEVDNSLKDSIVSFGKLVAQRRMAVMQYKLRIGTLAAGFLEDPQNRLKNLDALLMIMNGSDPAVAFTVPKLCALSLLAVFEDALPSYSIKNANPDGVKLKKDTLQLQSFESSLLAKYRMYLKKLENLVSKYYPRKKPRVPLSEAESNLGSVAFECMCGMLLSHPYFNFATNLTNFLVPYLNNWNPVARTVIFNTIKSIFRLDKRGEISYEIVRRINDLVKSRMSNKGTKVVHTEVLNVLLSLRIKEVDLLKEKEEEANPSKKLTFEQRKMMSKRQRKKSKDLVQLERELLEASAEENKEKKSRFLTDITKLVFTMYFRALKNECTSKILSCCLEGLSKFAHVINIDFFEDILKVLERLLNEGRLKRRQRLLCISTVLAVLDGQGASLTLDPTSFHKHLYTILADMRCGHMESDMSIALRCIRLALGKKKMPGPRAIAFAKRLATVALQVEHQDATAILMALQQVLRLHPSVRVLLDCEGGGASGVYLPELDDPDHSCASASTAWELTSLINHYHPWALQLAKVFVNISDKIPTELVTITPELICNKFDPSETMEFSPHLPEKKITASKTKARHSHFVPKTEFFRHIVENKELSIDGDFDSLQTVNFI